MDEKNAIEFNSSEKQNVVYSALKIRGTISQNTPNHLEVRINNKKITISRKYFAVKKSKLHLIICSSYSMINDFIRQNKLINSVIAHKHFKTKYRVPFYKATGTQKLGKGENKNERIITYNTKTDCLINNELQLLIVSEFPEKVLEKVKKNPILHEDCYSLINWKLIDFKKYSDGHQLRIKKK